MIAAIMNTPTALNGYRVIRSEQHKTCSTVMLIDNGRYIVATWWPELGDSWSWGHYFHFSEDGGARNDAFDDATDDFNKTAARNTGRR